MYIIAILGYIIMPGIVLIGIKKNGVIWQGLELKSTQQLKGICAIYIVLHHISFCSVEIPTI